MIITITDGTTTQTLAAGSARVLGSPVGPINLQISGPIQVQQRNFLRGSAAKFSNRGNMQSIVSFRSVYEFATIDLAQSFVLQHRSLVLRSDTLNLQTQEGAVSTISNVVLTDPACSQIGCTVFVDYQIVGGAQSHIAAPLAGIDADGHAMFDAAGEAMFFAES